MSIGQASEKWKVNRLDVRNTRPPFPGSNPGQIWVINSCSKYLKYHRAQVEHLALQLKSTRSRFSVAARIALVRIYQCIGT